MAKRKVRVRCEALDWNGYRTVAAPRNIHKAVPVKSKQLIELIPCPKCGGKVVFWY